MTPQQFISKWQCSRLNERQSYQAHFADLCDLVGAETRTPVSADNYCYERGVTQTDSKHGWADVWKRGPFDIEYKAPERNLDAALKQLMTSRGRWTTRPCWWCATRRSSRYLCGWM